MIRSKEIAEALHALQERSIKYIELSILQEGLALFQQQAVITMEMENSHVIIAKLKDVGPYETRLNIRLMGNSVCNCRSKEICSHMIAVYMAAYSFHGFRPDLIVKKAIERDEKVQTKPQEIAQPLRQDPKPLPTQPEKASKPPLTSKPVAPQSTSIHPTDSVAVWHSYYHARFKQFPSTNGFTDYNTIMNSMTKQLSSLCKDWPILMQYFFMMHVWLFQLQKLEGHVHHSPNNHSSSYYYSYGLKDAIQDCYRLLSSELKRLRETDLSTLTPQHREQTATLLSEIAFSQEHSSIDWDYYYRSIWNILLKSPNETAKEKLRLQNYLQNNKLSNNQREKANLALAYHWFIEGHDTQAMKCLEASGVKLDRYNVYVYLDGLYQINEPVRLQNWLLWYKPHLANTTKSVIEKYLGVWALLVEHDLSEEAFQQTIIDLLPGSSSYYIDRLIQQESYSALIDFMLTYQLSLSSLPSGITRKIESKQAALLLPYYYQTVEFLISCKNRDAYKDAVKALRKIHSLYKKLKQPENWEHYYSWIKSNYSRLSALQEEMLKGLKQS